MDQRRRTTSDYHEVEQASIERGVFCYGNHYHVVFASVYAYWAGRKTVPSVGVHQNIHYDCGCLVGDHFGSGTDFLFYEREIQAR
ncbi:hypothetical protein D3C85_1086790 [compost metagenome]